MDTTRREFLTAAGGIMACAALPSFAQDDPSIFPSRGKFERLTLNYVHINAGATKPFSVLHISDTHLTATNPNEPEVKQKLHTLRSQTFGGRQEEALRDTLAWAKLNTDYVVHTGDLIDWQSEANFELVKKYFGGMMFGSMGNHEFSPSMWLSNPKEARTEEFKAPSRQRLATAYGIDLELASKVINGVNFVTIDDVYGYVTERQVERFRAEVKKGLPIVLCMHVPFMNDNLWRWTMRFWRNVNKKFTSMAVPNPTGDYKTQLEDPTTRSFIAYLKKEPLLKGILAGHEHIMMQDRFSPTAMQYVVSGNFLFAGQEVTIS